MDKALALYSGRPYFPQVKVNDMDKIANFAKWADKYDLSSMYCSKLVYHTFKLAGLDLDSGRTRTANSRIAKIKDTDYAGKINNGWGGVSPDDIYYSKNLGKDLYYSNLHKLNSVFSWSLF